MSRGIYSLDFWAYTSFKPESLVLVIRRVAKADVNECVEIGE